MRYPALLFVGALLMALTLATAAFAQTAGESMHEAGHSAERAISHAWHGTKTAVTDTDITAKVKTALHEDKLTKGADIDVDTDAGVVTLSGQVPSSRVAERAQHVAERTNGVKSVDNKLRVTD